jgi:hypothetical protein
VIDFLVLYLQSVLADGGNDSLDMVFLDLLMREREREREREWELFNVRGVDSGLNQTNMVFKFISDI